MLRILCAIAIALSLLGCRSPAPSGEPVKLLTGPLPFDADECSNDDFVASMLLIDVQYGTVLAGFLTDQRTPVMWPPGYTARRVQGQVVVVDVAGNLVAVTGQSFGIRGNLLFGRPEPGLSAYRRGVVLSPILRDMLYACGPVHPEPTARLLNDLSTP